MNIQKADPYKPILSSNNGKPPLVLKLVVNRNDHFMEGVPGEIHISKKLMFFFRHCQLS